MKGSIRLLLILFVSALIIIATSIINSVVNTTKNPSWYILLVSIIALLASTVAATIFSNIIQDVWREGPRGAIKLWITRKRSDEQPINSAITKLADRCRTVANLCLKELEYKRVDPVTQTVKEEGFNFIRNLNWIYTEKILFLRKELSKQQSEHPNMDTDLIQLRLPIEPDELCSFKEIFLEKSNQGKQGFILLGLPGFGKTFSIYDCIRTVNDPQSVTKPMVFFSLTYWIKDKSLQQWMQDELVKSYNITSQDAELLVDKHLIYPVFDGLDQVHITLRNQCAKKIFDYSATISLILTCRPVEFEAVTIYLRQAEVDFERWFNVVELLPLGDAQVKSIIRNEMVFDKADEVINLIDKNQDFRDLIRSPMILYIVWRIQDRLTKEELILLKGKDNKDSIEYLWSLYDKYIFEEKSTNNGDDIRWRVWEKISFDEDKSRMWLHHIAKWFEQKSSIFIEHLQPNFLIRPIDLVVYIYLSRILTSVILACAAGFFLSGPGHFVGAGILAGMLIATITLIHRAFQPKLPRFLSWLNHVKVLLTILLYSLPTLGLLILFLGLTTPRGGADMRFDHKFALSEANVAVLLSLFIGFSHGIRESYRERGDIRPVEQIALNSLDAAWFGLKGGLLLGIFLIICVKIIMATGAGFEGWVKFNPYGFNIYLLAILVGVILGSPLLSLLRMLDDNNTSVGDEEKKRYNAKPNYGINKSAWNLGVASLIIGSVMVSLLGLFSGIITRNISCILKAIQAGFGASLLASLLFGGFDVINHFVLRLVIYSNGYGPRSFNDFFAFSSRLRLTRTLGASFNFVHATIGEYYREHGTLKLREGWKIRIFLFFALACLISAPIWFSLNRRYSHDFYWSNHNDFKGFVIEKIPSSLKRLTDSTFVVNKPDEFTMMVSGQVYFGTFLGYVGPEGTEAGFIGLRLGDSYDKKSLQRFPHGALIARRLNRTRPYFWLLAKSKNNWESLLPTTSRHLKPVHFFKNDTIQFTVNDREPENNFGKFTINITGRN